MLSARFQRPFTAAALAGTAIGGAYFISQRKRLPPIESALQPDTTLTCPLLEIEKKTADTSRFRFALPTAGHALGLPVAGHVLALDEGNVYREYTPITSDASDRGYFDLLVKLYPGGELSSAFHRLRVGDTMDFRGPVTTIFYEANSVGCLGMVAGGTGITPMYQIIRSVLSDPSDITRLRLLYASNSAADILLKREIDDLAARYPDQLQVHYLIGDKECTDEVERAVGTNVSLGRVGSEIVAELIPPPRTEGAAVLVCGPPGMMTYLCGPRPRTNELVQLGGLLGEMGYNEQVIQFR